MQEEFCNFWKEFLKFTFCSKRVFPFPLWNFAQKYSILGNIRRKERMSHHEPTSAPRRMAADTKDPRTARPALRHLDAGGEVPCMAGQHALFLQRLSRAGERPHRDDRQSRLPGGLRVRRPALPAQAAQLRGGLQRVLPLSHQHPAADHAGHPEEELHPPTATPCGRSCAR